VADALLALPFGLAIGLSLGLVGGGGAIMAVPVLVYVLDQDVKQATTASLVIVGATALVGALDHARAGRVRVRLALAIGAGGAGGALAGTVLNRLASPDTILFLFSFVLLAAAYAMLRRSDDPHPEPPLRPSESWLRALPAGAGVGLLTGFFGVGGGFLIVPLLVLLFGLTMKTAVGTSLLVIALTSAAALTAHLATGAFDWAIAGAFTAGGVIGALAGSRVSARVPAARLREAFALLVIALAGALLARDATSIL
jgi:uncharacterized protein